MSKEPQLPLQRKEELLYGSADSEIATALARYQSALKHQDS